MKEPTQWTEHHLQWMACPHCGDLHDFAQGVSEGDTDPPKDGDANVCIKCARISIYDSSIPGSLRLPTDDERAELEVNDDIKRIIVAIRAANVIVPLQRAKRN